MEHWKLPTCPSQGVSEGIAVVPEASPVPGSEVSLPGIGGVNKASLREVPDCLHSFLSSREKEEGAFITHLEILSSSPSCSSFTLPK